MHAPLLPLLSTTLLTQSDPSNTLQSTDGSAGLSLACQGTSTFTGYVPLQTVTVTVDGSYTYVPLDNNTSPTAILYTPPPACASVVVPESSASTTNGLLASLGITLPASALTPTPNATMATYTSVITWTGTVTTSTPCTPNFSVVSSTAIRGPPYANSSMPASTDTPSCGLYFRFGTYTTTQTFISAAQSAPASSASGGHVHPQNPNNPAPPPDAPSAAPPVNLSTNGPSIYATVTITKKTPVAIRQSSTAEQVVFPTTNLIGSPFAAPLRTSSKPVLLGGGNSNAGGTANPTKGNAVLTSANSNGQDKPASNGNSPPGNAPSSIISGVNNNPTGGNNDNNNIVGSSNKGNSVASASQTGGGIGSIINSAINSPFTTVGIITSYGVASATVSLVNGVPVQVQSSSVHIGGSYVAIPTGSSTALVTVNQQTFTIVSGAVIGGSSTLEIHRTERVSSSPVQAATLQASTITQDGVVVTIEPTAAIVSGKTYSIGLNARESKVVVNGQTVTLNSNGVVFASKTYAPAMITASAYVVTTIGGLTFSIDSSEAIISGTTYGIGAGALQSLVTTEIDGTKITFGPSGIVLPSKTIAPTGVSLTGAGMGSAATSGPATARIVSGSTASPTLSSSSAIRALQPSPLLFNSLCLFSIILALSTLPLGLLL